MGGTTVPKKLYYRIGEACRAVDIQPYVLRYWETEFDALAPGKSKSGQRVYTEHELGVIRRIKELLYEEGYTIAGAKKRLLSELEEGRSFASPEVEGELFEGGEVGEDAEGDEGEDDVQTGASTEPASDEAEPEDAEAAPPTSNEPEWARTEPALSNASEPGLGSEPAPAPAVVEAVDAVAESASSAEVTPKTAAPRKSRSRAKREVTSPASAAPSTPTAAEAPAESAVDAVSGAAPPSSAVDSALTERVETLEHGLRRVLAEVRHLRGLLADSDSGR
jgi:DNA-binding transcriptional MerR regulator